MRPTLTLALSAALLSSSGLVSASHAESAAVVVVGSATPKDRATVASAVRSAARSGSWELVETPFADAEIETVVGCLKATDLWSCVAPVATNHQVQRLIVVRVEPEKTTDGSSAMAVTERILLPGAKSPTLDDRYCPNCTDETLTRVTFDLTKRLLQEASAGSARTKLTIKSTPTRAWIRLDDADVGVTDHTFATFPGHHVVIVKHDHYETEVRQVDVAENQEATVDVTLHTKDQSQTETSTPHPYVLPSVVAGVGAAAVITGLVLDLSVDPPAKPPQPEHLVSTPGVALMIGGGVAIAASVYLFVRAHRQATSSPTASITPGGAMVGWTGRF